MRQSWLTGILAGAVVGMAAFALLSSRSADAQSPQVHGRVACVNVVYIFNEYQRQKDLTEEIADLQLQLQDEDTQRRDRLDKLKAELDALSDQDPTYVERMREMLALQIDYKNWRDLKEADLTREITLWSVRIYGEITAKVAEAAQEQGWDMVLYRGQFEPASTMDPEVIREQIRQTKLIYASDAVDITQSVLDKLNNEYRAQPRVKMMYVPD
jgi:Skp family chaperone for outer membrane proteins